jgi:hypothetical protein
MPELSSRNRGAIGAANTHRSRQGRVHVTESCDPWAPDRDSAKTRARDAARAAAAKDPTGYRHRAIVDPPAHLRDQPKCADPTCRGTLSIEDLAENRATHQGCTDPDQ